MISGANPKITVATCPGCGANIRFQEPVRLGEFVICGECGDELEIVGISPVRLDWAFEEPFDDDDDDFDDQLLDYEDYDDEDDYYEDDDYYDDDDDQWD